MTKKKGKTALEQQQEKAVRELLKDLEKDWDFNTLLKPYREGGTPEQPVRRTWGTIIDWLKNKHRFPEWAIGAGIFLTWMQIKNVGHFKGDGSFGSAGNEFVQAIRQMCASVMQKQLSQEVFSGMAGEVESRIRTAFKSDYWHNLPWFIKMLCPKYWEYRKIKKAQFKMTGEINKEVKDGKLAVGNGG